MDEKSSEKDNPKGLNKRISSGKRIKDKILKNTFNALMN
jgi:hypothetical protein